MLAKEQMIELQKINHIVNLIEGNKDRFQISIILNSTNNNISVLIRNLNNTKLIYENIMNIHKDNQIDFINVLRNNFILHGAMVSKLTPLKNKQSMTYCKQTIYLKNLEMVISISDKKEEFEAAKAHQTILKANVHEYNEQQKIKTIQLKSYVG